MLISPACNFTNSLFIYSTNKFQNYINSVLAKFTRAVIYNEFFYHSLTFNFYNFIIWPIFDVEITVDKMSELYIMNFSQSFVYHLRLKPLLRLLTLFVSLYNTSKIYDCTNFQNCSLTWLSIKLYTFDRPSPTRLLADRLRLCRDHAWLIRSISKARQ